MSLESSPISRIMRQLCKFTLFMWVSVTIVLMQFLLGVSKGRGIACAHNVTLVHAGLIAGHTFVKWVR